MAPPIMPPTTSITPTPLWQSNRKDHSEDNKIPFQLGAQRGEKTTTEISL
jgi:hypothetical protein